MMISNAISLAMNGDETLIPVLDERKVERAMAEAQAYNDEQRASATASKERYVAVATGMRLKYRTFGSSERGVVILHDVGECAAMYYGLARALGDRGYCVYVFDARGHGDSTRSRERIYSTRAMTDDLESFIIELDLYVRPIAIVGFGMGGVVASAMAAKNPRLVAATVLVESSPLAPVDAYAFFPTQTAEFDSPASAIRALCSPLFNDGRERNLAHVCRHAHAALEKVKIDGGRPSTRWKMDPAFFFSAGSNDDVWDDIERTRCHFALIHGENSSFVNASDARAIVDVARRCGAKSARALRVVGSSRRVCEDAPRDAREMIVYALMRADDDLIVRNKELRRPEMLGIRPLPQFATIEDALEALKPRRIPTSADVERALEDARAGDECASDDDTKAFNNRTALIQNDPEYFGFVG